MMNGTIAWLDLTVPDAAALVPFYEAVLGWSPSPISMGDYNDFAMIPAGSEAAAAGICHTRGPNADQPPGWMPYMLVADIHDALMAALAYGGTVVKGPINAGGAGQFAVVRDPSGATFALFQKPAAPADGEAPAGG